MAEISVVARLERLSLKGLRLSTTQLVPRKTRLLPYLRGTRSGRLEYVRRVPPERQKCLGRRRYLTQLLNVWG